MAVQAPSARGTPEYTAGWARTVNVIRWLLVAVLTLDLLAGLVTLPRQSSLAELQRDLRAGRAQNVTFVDGNELRALRLVRGGLIVGNGGSIVVWRTGTVSYRSARLDAGSGSGSLAAQRAGVPVRSQPGQDLLLRWWQAVTLVFLILLLTMLRAGQPRRATRWAAFWLLLLPLNAGMILTLIREAPWSRRARERPEPLPHKLQKHDGRTTGGHAFLFVLVACVLVQTLANLVARR